MVPLCVWRNIPSSALNINHLRIFGCAAYTTLPASNRDGKFAPTAIAGIHVGYDSDHKGYRIFYPPSKKIYVSTQVKFDEMVFPLENSKATVESHDFATSVIGGIPVYPSTGAVLGVPRKAIEPITDSSDKCDEPTERESSVISDLADEPEMISDSEELSTTSHATAEELLAEINNITKTHETTISQAQDQITAVTDENKRLTDALHSATNMVEQLRRHPKRSNPPPTDITPTDALLPTSQPTKKRGVMLENDLPSIPIVTQVTTPDDQVIRAVTQSTASEPTSLEELHSAAIRSHPNWSPSGFPIGDLSIPDFNTTGITPGSFISADNHGGSVRTIISPLFNQLSSNPPSPSASDSSFINVSAQHLALSAVATAFSSQGLLSAAPNTIKQAMARLDANIWRAACEKELNAFQKQSTFKLVPAPGDARPLGTRWVFTLKSNNTAKARLVAQGHRQRASIDYTETFSPVIHYASVRVFLALSATMSYLIHQMDVDTAFLNSKLDEPVYVRQPPGFIDTNHPDWVWRLEGDVRVEAIAATTE
ncbi:hypothetical protein KAFR_0A01750 [Kazachstania africana CBS 2517]|uniref:Uncharacterized protein n=1 Tax=Kazachstania africana (strain ATCC 22294 / BCRC 22015 / CBS 2517 / CECT 1963 / NBRC 1671 / NRRL Y-8276) TaxID=1071382 RepID=H2AML3_KAZAF|nr:hypothetical protein KAFR_0A01750 [Kazachstania africana CBS 2517]CCF55613.1 hypothetical protein KAFR_0A01750 [Kazachstania africana CBS 2517]